MSADTQLFDRPVEDYLEDDNALKVFFKADFAERVALDESLAADLEKARHSVAGALRAAFQNWDPTKGPDHEAEVKQDLKKTLDQIAQNAVALLSAEQRETVRMEQKRLLGYGYVFLAEEDDLRLDGGQRTRLKELEGKASRHAAEAIRDELSRVQIRNPQAYFAFGLAIEVKETRKARQHVGKEFFDESLSDEQRRRVKVD